MNKLIKLSDTHYIVVNDSEIKEGDWFYYKHFGEDIIAQAKETTDLVNLNNPDRYFKKVTHSTQPLSKECKTCTGYCEQCVDETNSLSLSEVKELIGEVDVHLKAMSKYSLGEINNEHDFTLGYNQAIEDNKDKKYTEEDLKKAYMVGKHGGVTQTYYEFDDYIQSIQPKTEWEVEIVKQKQTTPYISDDFQIGPDGAFEYEDDLKDWDNTLNDGLEDE